MSTSVILLWVPLQWTTIQSGGSWNTLSCFMLGHQELNLTVWVSCGLFRPLPCLHLTVMTGCQRDYNSTGTVTKCVRLEELVTCLSP